MWITNTPEQFLKLISFTLMISLSQFIYFCKIRIYFMISVFFLYCQGKLINIYFQVLLFQVFIILSN
ncbi:hypothetical protein pb186bvf_011407 [Paramecium bursaria]